MRKAWKWLLFFGVPCLLSGAIFSVQRAVDTRFEARMRPYFEHVEAAFGETRARGAVSPTSGSVEGRVGLAQLTTRLVRRDCAGRWTFGLGARVEIEEVTVSVQTSAARSLELRAGRACLDLEVESSLTPQAFRLVQAAPIHFEGPCGPTISAMNLAWAPKVFDGSIEVTDRSNCLQMLRLVAPQYPSHLIPVGVELEISLEDTKREGRKLSGNSPVVLIAELARRLENAEFSIHAKFGTSEGGDVMACLRRRIADSHSEFAIGLGVSESALDALTQPFVSGDARRILMDLRSDEANCEGGENGLEFTSDLVELSLHGEKLARLAPAPLRSPGMRETYCADAT